MSIDGRFLRFLSEELHQTLQTGRIQKISQLGKTDFLVMVRAQNKNQKLYISLSTSLARINISQHDYPSDYLPGGFCMFLRKHLEGSFVEQIQTLQNDRILEITFNATNEIGDRVTLYLIMEMFSRYTNLILLDAQRNILNAYKHISPFEAIDRTIVNGVSYMLPEDDKIDPDDLDSIRTFFEQEITYKDIVQNIRGTSPLFANYLLKQANHNQAKLFEVYQEIQTRPIKPTLCLGQKTEFYYIDIFTRNQRYFETLSELIDYYFKEASSLERVKQIHKYLTQFTKREYKRKKHKLEKLTVDLENAKEHDIWRIKGDTLISNQHLIQRGDNSFKGFSYELGNEIEIELDRLLNPIQNANKYYTKYKKQKTAVTHIEKQIRITKREIQYFGDLLEQIKETNSLNDLNEIQDELVTNGYLPKKKHKVQKNKPNFDTYVDEQRVKYYVGKNNLQNNYLTHKFAKKDDWWFHVKNQTGSHVLVQEADALNESIIRTAAMLAAYHSKSKLSGSVPVDYTMVKHIKKVPGKLGSYVTYTNQKTIYIDPDEAILKSLSKSS